MFDFRGVVGFCRRTTEIDLSQCDEFGIIYQRDLIYRM